MSNSTIARKVAPLANLKVGEEDGLKEGEFIVYPSTFTKEPDSYGDIVAPGAFAETIDHWAKSGNVLPGLFGHRMDDPDYYVASAIDMGEDDHGWWVKGKFDLDTPKARQVYRLVKGRRLNQLSFAYDVQEAANIKSDSGDNVRELRKVHVHEFSFVPVGANQDTSVVAVKEAGSEDVEDEQNDEEEDTPSEPIAELVASVKAAAAEFSAAVQKAVSDFTEKAAMIIGEGKASATPPAKSTTDEEPKADSSATYLRTAISIRERESREL